MDIFVVHDLLNEMTIEVSELLNQEMEKKESHKSNNVQNELITAPVIYSKVHSHKMLRKQWKDI